MKKLVLAGILLMFVATAFVFSKAGSISNDKTPSQAKKDEMISLAKKKYEEVKKRKTNLENGPCLGMIAVGWVADIANNPRTKTDDEADNQCPEYRSGAATHFVELDLNGNLIRTK